jgi:mannose-1-phosphate guanylyltransferase/mannose-1-phosphate guanylyltransferase/mannose-6-phosphate isomerase
VVAGKNHINPIIGECAGLDTQERKRLVLIPEPLARNTAPAIACALVYLNRLSGGRDRNVLVLTGDHVISPPGTFKIDAKAAAAMAQGGAQGGKLAVFGIRPERPETGFGYIEAAGALSSPDSRGRRKYRSEVFSVASFREKPDLKTAKKFIREKKFYWNSGMFVFSSQFMLAEFLAGAPEVINPFMELWAPGDNPCRSKKGLKILEGNGKLEAAYMKTKAISFDYAIAEKCRSTVMVKAGFSWNDVGSWDEYARLADNTMPQVYGTEGAAETCFVDSDIPVALCGVEDLIVVLRSGKDGGPPALLISKKGETQRVKEIVEMIKASGRTELL